MKRIVTVLKLCLAIVLAASAAGAQAQGCLTTVLPSDGGTSGNARAPIANFRFERTAYLIKPSEMAAAPGFPNGSQPLSIAWTYTTAPGVVATAPLTIYMQNTADSTYTKGTSWATVITGMTTVHTASTTIPNVAGTFEITLAGGSPFTYTGGGLYIAFDWGNYTGTLGTAVVSCNSTGLVGGLAGAQSTLSAPVTLAVSSFRPQTLLRPLAGLANDASVDLVMSLGSQPLGITGAQTIQARVSNKGSSAISNLAVTLTVSGANSFTDTQIVPALAFCGGAANVTFAPFTATALGSNTVTVTVPADDAGVNNSLSKPMDVTIPLYSYKHPGTTAGGGVGLTGGVGAFVAKFTTTQPTSVISADLEFFAVVATTYRVAIYGDAGGIPSTTALYVDAADRTIDAAGPVSITLPAPVPVGPGSFYVGVQQTNTTNANYSFDSEAPLRSGTFYFSGALPVTAWTDLAPANGFKLNIGATLDRCNFTPSASNDGPFCPGEDLQLTSSAAAAVSYAWTGPNSFTSFQQNPLITGASAAADGSYTVTVNGCASGTQTTATALADTDGDGTCDIDDGCPDDPAKTVPGNCGCGVAETGDTDGDGTFDCNDGCPLDPGKIAPGQCGCGALESADTDSDGVLDCVDDCPTIPGEFGSPCDDGDVCTTGDVLIAGCICAGTFQDADSDGLCDANDPCPNLAFLTNGDPCDDGNTCTTGDIVTGCVCAGTSQDTDNDGICDENDNCPTLFGEQGDACDDGNPNTTLDVITASCVCAGVNQDCEGTPGGPELPGTDCDDANACTINDTWNISCVCAGTFQDADSDGICDADDDCPNLTGEQGDACDDGDVCTTGDAINASCVCAGTFTDTDSDGLCDANDDCPTLSGVQGDACDDGDANTTNDVIDPNCECHGTPCTQNNMKLTFDTDADGEQISWYLVEQTMTDTVCGGSGLPDNSNIIVDCCLADGCYDLVVTDMFGDGIHPGGFVLRTVGGQRIIDNAGNGHTFSSVSKSPSGFCLPLSAEGLMPASCDIENATLSTVLQAQPNAVVTAFYTPSNVSQQGYYGYQYWVTNPHGGFSRRILLTLGAPGSGWPAGTAPALKPTYFALSSMNFSAPFIPRDILLNVRVRAYINGVYGLFGPACRLRIPYPPCSTSQLTTTATPVVSCGATGLTLSSTIHADAVTGGTNYQFEFSKSGYLRRITQPVRSTALSFVTNPLQNNNCYDVRVRVSTDGGLTFCPFGPVCTITIGTAICGGAMAPQADEGNTADIAISTRLTLWPNPNDGSTVYISFTDLDTGLATVTMDVTDLYGKLITTRTFPAGSSYLNTVIAFEQDLAPGMYLVNLQAGKHRFTERLMIQR